MSTEEMPDWVEVGADAFIVQTPTFGVPSLRAVTIEKVGKRDVVAGGRRFNGSSPLSVYAHSGHYELHESGNRFGRANLIAPSDPRIPEWRDEIRRQRLHNEARAAIDVWLRDRTAENARAVIDAFEPLTASSEREGQR